MSKLFNSNMIDMGQNRAVAGAGAWYYLGHDTYHGHDNVHGHGTFIAWPMHDSEFGPRSDPLARGKRAEAILAELLAKAGWRVRRRAEHGHSPHPDLVIDRQGASYAVEVKAAAEGRSDRLIPLWAQAYLQAARAADDKHRPLAVIAAPRIAPRVAEHVLKFAEMHAPEAAAGVIDFAGLRMFRGSYLEGLDSESAYFPSMARSAPIESASLFSDLSQWMLKVLLAPELPVNLLSAPRGRYRNASQLAEAAKVSRISAYRFVQQLRREGYLHESAPYLNIVRREDLFRNWQVAAMRRVKEVPMRFLLHGNRQVELKRMLRSNRACLALFAAAEALKVGFVHGVPPHVYVPRLDSESIAAWKNIVPVKQNEAPDFILRQASAPQSVFRGIVRVDDVPVCDILQVWLDVSPHRSRGQEQADLIRRRILDPVIGGKDSRG